MVSLQHVKKRLFSEQQQQDDISGGTSAAAAAISEADNNNSKRQRISGSADDNIDKPPPAAPLLLNNTNLPTSHTAPAMATAFKKNHIFKMIFPKRWQSLLVFLQGILPRDHWKSQFAALLKKHGNEKQAVQIHEEAQNEALDEVQEQLRTEAQLINLLKTSMICIPPDAPSNYVAWNRYTLRLRSQQRPQRHRHVVFKQKQLIKLSQQSQNNLSQQSSLNVDAPIVTVPPTFSISQDFSQQEVMEQVIASILRQNQRDQLINKPKETISKEKKPATAKPNNNKSKTKCNRGNSNVKKTNHVLCFGYNLRRDSAHGVDAYFPNTICNIVTDSAWTLLHKKIGDELMTFLLQYAIILIQLPNSCYLQVTGYGIL